MSTFSEATLASKHRYTPPHFFSNGLLNLFAVLRNNHHAGIFLNTMHNKVDCFGCYQVRQDCIQRCYDVDHVSRYRKNDDVQNQYDITNSQGCFSARVNSQHFGSIDDAASSDRKSDSQSKEKPTKKRNQ